MTGFPTPLYLAIVLPLVSILAVAFRRWYAARRDRSIAVLCIALAFLSPWLAVAVFVVANAPILLVAGADAVGRIRKS